MGDSVTLLDRMIGLGQGNPGALTVLSVVQREHTDRLPGLVDTLEQHMIYGSDIWVVYKNHCAKNIDRFLAYPFERYHETKYHT